MKYRSIQKYKYQLLEDEIYETEIENGGIGINGFVNLSPQGTLVISRGYCWNGASGPTFDTESSMRASLVHDALYQLIRQKKLSFEYRKLADDIFYAILLEDGMPKWRAWLWYQAVRKFAGYAAK